MEDLFRCLADIADRCMLINLEESDSPKEEVREGERVIGELPHELRKLFLARANLLEEIVALEGAEELDFDADKEIVCRKSLAGLMLNILWHEATMDTALKLWQYEGKVVVLRAGWKVAIVEDRRKEQKVVPQERRSGYAAKPSMMPIISFIFPGPQSGPPMAM